MRFESGLSVSERQPGPAFPFHHDVPLALSFTRFVAAHGGSDSLRATVRTPAPRALNPLTFARHLWPVTGVLGSTGVSSGNGETV